MMKILFITIILISITGCANAGLIFNPADTILKKDTLIKKQEKSHSSNPETVLVFDDSKLAPQNVRMIFNELFRQYITIKDALVYSDPYNSKRNTLKLLEDMRSKTKDIQLLKRDDRWTFFINNYDNIRSKVEAADFISQQRFLFNEITNGIQNFIKQFGLYNKTIYLMKSTAESQYGNNEWLSDSKDEKNPYLGMINDTTYTKVIEAWKF
ncbi:MAG TPA: DUF3347 domain-containing protein [Ignavibacteria bacterium]|nr:DUF3347 domain-containing protein [Ignavibacteria bacterium]